MIYLVNYTYLPLIQWMQYFSDYKQMFLLYIAKTIWSLLIKCCPLTFCYSLILHKFNYRSVNVHLSLDFKNEKPENSTTSFLQNGSHTVSCSSSLFFFISLVQVTKTLPHNVFSIEVKISFCYKVILTLKKQKLIIKIRTFFFDELLFTIFFLTVFNHDDDVDGVCKYRKFCYKL